MLEKFFGKKYSFSESQDTVKNLEEINQDIEKLKNEVEEKKRNKNNFGYLFENMFKGMDRNQFFLIKELEKNKKDVEVELKKIAQLAQDEANKLNEKYDELNKELIKAFNKLDLSKKNRGYDEVIKSKEGDKFVQAFLKLNRFEVEELRMNKPLIDEELIKNI